MSPPELRPSERDRSRRTSETTPDRRPTGSRGYAEDASGALKSAASRTGPAGSEEKLPGNMGWAPRPPGRARPARSCPSVRSSFRVSTVRGPHLFHRYCASRWPGAAHPPDGDHRQPRGHGPLNDIQEISNSLPSRSFRMAYFPQSTVVSGSENSTPFRVSSP